MSGLVEPSKKTVFSYHKAAFSLAEMLVVMGILAILLVVTVPAFRGLNQTGSRRAAVNNLMGALDRARTMAVSDGKATYVVFYARAVVPGGALTDSATGPWGRAYAIFQDKDNVSFVPVQRTPWIYLPAGISFKVDGNRTPSVTNQSLGGDTGFPVTAAYATGGVTNLVLPYWKFDPTGALDEQTLNAATSTAAGGSATYLRVLMFPGFLQANGAETGTQPGAAGNNLNPSVLEEIDLNPVTGRAKYIVNPADNLVTPTPSSSPQS